MGVLLLWSVTQAATASANREVKVLIEGKEVDALELLQKLNARGAKKHLNFVETKEGFDFRIKVDITTTTKLGEPGFLSASIVVENNKAESLFFVRTGGRFNAKRALDEAARQIIEKLEPYLMGKTARVSHVFSLAAGSVKNSTRSRLPVLVGPVFDVTQG